MNYMKQVAQMLGVELEEEFTISFNENTKYRFTELGGLEYFHEPIGRWMVSPTYFYKILNGTYEIVKIPKPILDEAEKRYLSNVIKPFRGRVRLICKSRFSSREHIAIILDDSTDKDLVGYIALPTFKEGTMCKGMELDKRYTLEELGL